MPIRIVVDSSADFDRTEAKRLNIDIVPMSIQFGDQSFLDGISLSKADFYKQLSEGSANPYTAQPAPSDFLPYLQAAKEAGDEVLIITISSVLSGTYQSAVISKTMCDYSPIYIIDSLTATAGIQILAEEACRLRDLRYSAAQITQELENLKPHIRIFAIVDTLEYLRRGGRLSNFQAGLGTVTKLKPVLTVREGSVVVVGKSFGQTAAMKQMLKFLDSHPISDNYPAIALTSDDPTRENALIHGLNVQSGLPKILRHCSIGPTIGAHIGPGAVGIAYVEE
ncbi:MAG: DegV family protein [Oscillospiraceae bacterium]|nr:DegV family protein [Oscillospiraceae bacterium]